MKPTYMLETHICIYQVKHQPGAAVGSGCERSNRGYAACGYNIPQGRIIMNNIVYIVGLVVVVIAVLSFFGMR